MALTKKQFLDSIKIYADLIHDNKEILTEYDRLIGDADHGINMDRGMQAVLEKVASYEDMQLSEVLKDVGMTLVSNVGGASGPLYGTAFMQGALAALDKEELENEDVLEFFDKMIEGIKRRGKAEAGEKTMLDALIPARDAFKSAIDLEKDTVEALADAKEAAWKGVEDTIDMVATKGRASYLGERSKGTQDPGATSTAYLFDALDDASKEDEDEEIETVGIVVVSHSPKIAEGVVDLALEMAPDAKIAMAGGAKDGSIGTDLNKIIQAIEEVNSPMGVVLLVDIGSAQMASQMAIETIGSNNVEILDAPIVEGAVFAAIESVVGSDIERIKEVLASSKVESKF